MRSRSKPIKILAIAPGKRKFGFALFTGVELTYFALKSFRKAQTERELINEAVNLMREVMDSFDPGVIAMRAISKYQRTSSILKPMCTALKREAGIKNIPLIEITLNQIISTFCNNKKATKKDVFRRLAQIYPELIHFMERPNHWQNQYYDNLFMAASVGGVLVKIQNQRLWVESAE